VAAKGRDTRGDADVTEDVTDRRLGGPSAFRRVRRLAAPRRAAQRRAPAAGPTLTGAVTVTDHTVAGQGAEVPVRVYGRPLAEVDVPFVWLHGGAFMSGGLDQRESHAVALAVAATGRTVVTVDYRLVPRVSFVRAPRGDVLPPGTRFPAPLLDVLDAVEWTARQSRSGEVVLGGASAGACLAVAAAVRLRDHGAAVPPALVLAYGTFHAALPPMPPHLQARLRGVHGLIQFDARTVERFNRNYAGSPAAMTDPHAFPGGHDLTGLPATLMVDADRDTLAASGETFAGELHRAGVDVERHVVAGSRHGFLDRPSTPHFAAGVDLVAQWLDHRGL
jgi:acetyl esterase